MQREELAWNLFAELRKEVLSTQQLRAGAIAVKITFVATALGAIVAYVKPMDVYILMLPAFASAFFDLLIISYSFAIKRKGAYARTCLEPILREFSTWPDHIPLWEEYMSKQSHRQVLSFVANVGFSFLVAAPAFVLLIRNPQTPFALPLVGSLGGLLLYVAHAHNRLNYFLAMRTAPTRLSAPYQ